MMVSKVQYCALLAVLVFDVNCQQNSESSVSRADLAQVVFIKLDFKNMIKATLFKQPCTIH